MHWFLRAAIACLASWAAGVVLVIMVTLLAPAGVTSVFIQLLPYLVMSTMVAAALTVYGLLTRRYYARRPFDGETRCRRCGYILRGISEPRCPECGERI